MKHIAYQGAIADRLRAADRRDANWQRWGTYLSERQWGTVREDYSAEGNTWTSFTHDDARVRAYRWGEDGLLGWTDRECRLAFAVTLWNGADPFLKERLFGLTGPEGNHAEDVKELYYYLDAAPDHSYCKGLYKYPLPAFPYDELRRVNRERSLDEDEYELLDTKVFDNSRYVDVLIEYAKADVNDCLIRLTLTNRSDEAAAIHLLPTFWFRNTWSWGCQYEDCTVRPLMWYDDSGRVMTDHVTLGSFVIDSDFGAGPSPDSATQNGKAGASPKGQAAGWLFTENETNVQAAFGLDAETAYTKDAFHRYVIDHQKDAVHPGQRGTKTAAYQVLTLEPGQPVTVRLRMVPAEDAPASSFGPAFDQVFADRIRETEEFYAQVLTDIENDQARHVARSAYAGLIWTKQFYHYVVDQWIQGDPDQVAPPPGRGEIRNGEWFHLFNRDVLSMPDKWEYPWYAVWDTAFHMVPMARVDLPFAKSQLELFLREWYMHPNGQLPAYEFNFSDVNPPVHAWAVWKVYQQTVTIGRPDRTFLASAFQKLLLNFTWWVNRKDTSGKNIFSGGFLGMDNIGIFDRSRPEIDGDLQQADGTAWMAFYCAVMLEMAIELALEDSVYEGMASKFFEHFVHIMEAINTLGGTGLWDDQDGFYYDQIERHDDVVPLRVRSMVGLIPLLASTILHDSVLEKLPNFTKRMNWFLEYKPELGEHISYVAPAQCPQSQGMRLLALPSRERLEKVLSYLLSEDEFLSEYGIRSLSKYYGHKPFKLDLDGKSYSVGYEPGESRTRMFGGNSNWRGPIWFPINYLLIESLRRFHEFYQDTLTVEFPTGSGNRITLKDAAREIEQRLVSLFVPDDGDGRPCQRQHPIYQADPHFRDLVLFHEYFHAETGRGLGASHQTGWTSLVALLIEHLERDEDTATVKEAAGMATSGHQDIKST